LILTQFEFAKSVRDSKVNIYVGLITAAVIGLSIKVVMLASRFKLLTTAINASTVSAGLKTLSIKIMGNAAAIATPKILALKLAVIALKGVGVGLVAVGFMAITKAALDAREATRQLLGSMRDLADTEAGAKKTTGVSNTKILRKIRETVQGGNEIDIENLRKRHPKAVKFMEDSIIASEAPAAPKGLIGLGGVGKVSGGVSGISASTSLISTGDLATMMQTGGAAKRDTEIGELQGINTKLQELIELQGGVT